MSTGRLVATAIIIWASVRTASYGIWTWRNNNKPGAFMIFLVSLAALILPFYAIFIRQ